MTRCNIVDVDGKFVCDKHPENGLPASWNTGFLCVADNTAGKYNDCSDTYCIQSGTNIPMSRNNFGRCGNFYICSFRPLPPSTDPKYTGRIIGGFCCKGAAVEVGGVLRCADDPDVVSGVVSPNDGAMCDDSAASSTGFDYDGVWADNKCCTQELVAKKDGNWECKSPFNYDACGETSGVTNYILNTKNPGSIKICLPAGPFTTVSFTCTDDDDITLSLGVKVNGENIVSSYIQITGTSQINAGGQGTIFCGGFSLLNDLADDAIITLTYS